MTVGSTVSSGAETSTTNASTSNTTGPMTTGTTSSTTADTTTTSGTTGNTTVDPTDGTTGGMDPVCGNGVVEAGETCDAGADNGPGHACKADCEPNTCGDGDIGPGESCDDGNNVDGDGCDADCVLPSCGNNKLDPGEECDDGKDGDDTDECTDACLLPVCGDEIVQMGEQCDLGPGNSDAGACTSACADAVCGDGLVWNGVEACDDGNNVDDDMCSNTCMVVVDQDCDGAFDPGQFCFANPGQVLASGDPRFVLVGKFNNDAHLDVVAVEMSNKRIHVRIADGMGGFDGGANYAIPDNSPIAAASADMDGDGDLDLAIIDGLGIVIMTNTGAAKFINAGPTMLTSAAPKAIVAADLDGDGDPDLATAEGTGNQVTVRWGAAQAGFSAPSVLKSGLDVSDIAAIDMQGDGKIDLVALNSKSGTVSVYLNQGNRVFARQKTYRVPLGATIMEVGDLTGDGRPDLVIVDPKAKGFYLRKGNAQGGFIDPAYHEQLGLTPLHLTLADVNADGDLDAVAPFSSGGKGSLLVALGDGAGKFGGAVQFPVTSTPVHVAVADMDADGRVDLIDADYAGGKRVEIFYSDPDAKSPACQAICQVDQCGDGLLTPQSEDCDDGNAVDDDGCKNDCTFPPLTGCGNLTAEPGEMCFSAISLPHTHAYTVISTALIVDGDYNKDGILDLAIGLSDTKDGFIDDWGHGEAHEIWLGTGEGGYEILVKQRMKPLGMPGAHDCNDNPGGGIHYDFNKDGKEDILFVCDGAAVSPYNYATIAVKLGNGDGTFGNIVETWNIKEAKGYDFGDVDKDNQLDVVFQDGFVMDGIDATIYFGLPTGEFDNGMGVGVAAQYSWPLYPQFNGTDMLVGDVNGDSNPDMVVLNQFYTILGNGDGTFQKNLLKTNYSNLFYGVLRDFNKDGILDIGGCDLDCSDMSIFIGDGSGLFAKLSPTVVNGIVGTQYGSQIVSGDFDNDGNLDLLTSAEKNSVSIVRGDGNTGLLPAVNVTTPSTVLALATAEVSKDPRPDIFVGHYNQTVLMRSNP